MFLSHEDEELKFLEFTLLLYSIPSLQENVIANIIDRLASLMSDAHIPFLASEIQNELKIQKVREEVCEAIQVICDQNKQPFHYFKKSDKNFSRRLGQDFFYNEPETFVVGYETVTSKADIDSESVLSDKTKDVKVPRYAIHVPLKNSLKVLFSIPGMLQEILDYEVQLENEWRERNVMSNVMQGQAWRSIKTRLTEKKMFPLILYMDDFDPFNELGSHGGEQKVTGVYVSCPFLPPHLINRKENVILRPHFTVNTIHYFRKILSFTKKS